MLRARRVFPAGAWPLAAARGRVSLGYDDRHRRRWKLVSDRGEAFLLDLPQAAVLQDGDGLALEDGGWIAVAAAPEPLLAVTAGNAGDLCRLAWHLGNRHVPAAIAADHILIRDDHVIAAMLIGLGAQLERRDAPFTPEHGAYQGGHTHAPGPDADNGDDRLPG
jgi:urease accessory protein